MKRKMIKILAVAIGVAVIWLITYMLFTAGQVQV